jgi:membrane-associated HD superfamily phosphohydrolase
MENLNFDNDAIVDPKDSEIAELKKQLEDANRRDELKAEQLDQFGDAIMGVIGDKVEALAESIAEREIDAALDNYEFEIWNYQDAINDMIDERLPEGLDDESRADDLKSAVREILAEANVKIELE